MESVSANRLADRLSRRAPAFFCLIALLGVPALAATFGTVVPVGGHASDIALDEPRGVVYVANYTANRIDVVSIAQRKIQTSLNVSRQPAALALSPDGRYLLITHLSSTGTALNLMTIKDLNNNTTSTVSFGSAPLGVAFGNDGKALVLTSSEFLIFDPVTRYSQMIAPAVGGTAPPPQTAPCEPRQFIRAMLTTSGDGSKIWGIADAAPGTATSCAANDTFLIFHYDVPMASLAGQYWVAEPPMSPRYMATDRTGTFGLTGWSMFHWYFYDVAEWQKPSGQFEIGSAAYDNARGLVYGHVVKGSLTGQTGAGPQLIVADAVNLTTLETLNIAENLAGRSILDSAGNNLYAVSQSGLMVLPVGSLNAQNRVAAQQEDLLFRGNWCDRRSMTQDLVITNPGGGHTDFSLSTNMPGVHFSAASGTTPAKVTVYVDTYAYHNNNGTSQGQIFINSSSAVNVIPPVRVLVNNHEPDQRGALLNIPGTLVDMATDTARNRILVLRQDKNQVLVYDGSNLTKLATLKTPTTPTSMAITPDHRWLVVGAENAQVASVYDLETLRFEHWVNFPAGHYPRAIAASNRAVLAVSRLAGTVNDCSTGMIDRVDAVSGFATALPAIGVWKNCVDPATALTSSPTGASIFGAVPDGTVLLYDAEVDDFVAMRQNFDKLSGGIAALSDEQFVAGGVVLNSSLIPDQTFDASAGETTGAITAAGTAIRTAALSSSNAGFIERVDLEDGGSVRAARMTEAPLMSDASIVGRTFTRTLSPLPNGSGFVALTTSGLTTLVNNYDQAVALPQVNAVVNAADSTTAVAPGGLVSLYGLNLSPSTGEGSTTLPLPTLLGESCLSINGQLVPLIYVSSQQINAQLPYSSAGDTSIVLHTPAGVSNSFHFAVTPTAPAVFRTNIEGWSDPVPTVFRFANGQQATLSNPVHLDDTLVIYTTGLGAVTPTVTEGNAAPANPPAQAQTAPKVTLGGADLSVEYAGLTPGSAGLYQINVKVPFKGVKTGMQVPLTIDQGDGAQTTINVRVVD